MHRNHRLFFLFGLLLLFSVFFAFLYYLQKYKPLPPKPPVVDYRIPASDSISYSNAILYDFENFIQTDLLSAAKAYSGKFSMHVSGKDEFSLVIQKPISELPSSDFSEARMGAWMLAEKSEPISGKLMFQIVDKTNTLKYSYSVDIDEKAPLVDHWFYISGKANISYKPQNTDIVKVYYWNHCPAKVYMDDVLIILGSQKIRGEKPLVDNTKDNYKFEAQPNQPPYPTIFAQKTLAVNFKNASIVSLDGKESLKMEAGDSFLTGHFIMCNNRLDQLLLIRNQLPCAVIRFVPEKNAFTIKMIERTAFAPDLKEIRLLTADINGNGVDEMIIISGRQQKIWVYAYNFISEKVGLISSELCPVDKAITNVQKFQSKNGKHVESLIATDMAGGVFLLNFEKGLWNAKPLGNISETGKANFDSQMVSGKFIKPEGNDNILLFYRERSSGKCFYKLFDIDSDAGKFTCLQQGSFDNKCDTLYPEYNYFARDIDGDGISELISFGNSWRFDMKLIRFTEKDYRIQGNLDFKGYEADHNPKYYENLMIATGYFTNMKALSLFTVCMNKHLIPDLPETMGIYSLPLMEKGAAK
jgi:hypothetical protein